MVPALVIGNGESRKSINLQNLKNHFITVGCNAIHRDLTVDHLICCDNRMVKEALNNDNTIKTKIYTRELWYREHRKIKKNRNVYLLPELPYQSNARPDQSIHWGSGPYAVLVGSELSDEIHMIGFDLYGINDKVNNIYKNSNNYASHNKSAVDYSYWLYQIQKTFQSYKNKRFLIYNNSEWTIPLEWKCKNVVFLNLNELLTLTLNTESV